LANLGVVIPNAVDSSACARAASRANSSARSTKIRAVHISVRAGAAAERDAAGKVGEAAVLDCSGASPISIERPVNVHRVDTISTSKEGNDGNEHEKGRQIDLAHFAKVCTV